MDKDGYPEESELEEIRKWPYKDSQGLLKHIAEMVDQYGLCKETKPGHWVLSTGGWSGNEDIMGALQDNIMFWALCWQSSERGGRYIFEVNDG